MTQRLFTIGYEGRDVREVVTLLRAAGVRVLVDVRETPWSRKPGFSRRALEASLAACGIEYVHAKYAGNPKEIRALDVPHDEVLRRYVVHLDENPDVDEQLESLVGELSGSGKPACLLCFERSPDRCHRTVLAERWVLRGDRQVEHLGRVSSARAD